MSDQKSSEGGGSPKLAGKVIIPDLSPIAAAQQENVGAVSAVTTEMASSLQEILAGQQACLKQALEGLEVSVAENSGIAGIPSSQVPDLGVALANFKIATDNFSATAQKITQSTTKSNGLLTESIAKSMAKIEEVAQKFSGG